MPTIEVRIEELADVLKRDEKLRQQAVMLSIPEAAAAGVPILQEAAPKAFGLLRESIDSRPVGEGAELVVDTPYAAAVENGCRPHWPPKQPIVDWVKQKLFGGGWAQQKAPSEPVANVTAAGKKGAAAPKVEATPAKSSANIGDEIEKIADAVRYKIATEGIEPTLFVFSKLDKLANVLGDIIRNRLK